MAENRGSEELEIEIDIGSGSADPGLHDVRVLALGRQRRHDGAPKRAQGSAHHHVRAEHHFVRFGNRLLLWTSLRRIAARPFAFRNRHRKWPEVLISASTGGADWFTRGGAHPAAQAVRLML